MSLPAEKKQRSLFDVPVLAGGLLDGESSRYRVFREKIMPALWDKRDGLAELYCQDNGRPAIEPVVAMGVTLLQFMEKVPDRKAVENVKLHLGWKYGLDLEIGDKGFHHTSLVNFRGRLLEGGAERIGFDALLEALRSEGLVRKRSKQRLDSTHVLGAVARMGRLEMVRETIRVFLSFASSKSDIEHCPQWGTWQERYLDCEVQWHRADKKTLIRGSQQAGEDAVAMIG